MRERPNPRSVRDLRLMYETTSRIDGIIERKNLMPEVMYSRDYHEGDITGIELRVVPSDHRDLVTACVQRTQVTNLREDGSYCPRRITDWSKEYTFAEFRESPFYEMCVDAWGDCGWDTHLMDEYEVFDDGMRWGVYAHVYEHRSDWLGNWDKTGDVEAVDISLDEDGGMEVGLTYRGRRECVYQGDVWTLQRIVEEHDQMLEQMKRLKEHGIDLDEGTLSIRLWEER